MYFSKNSRISMHFSYIPTAHNPQNPLIPYLLHRDYILIVHSGINIFTMYNFQWVFKSEPLNLIVWLCLKHADKRVHILQRIKTGFVTLIPSLTFNLTHFTCEFNNQHKVRIYRNQNVNYSRIHKMYAIKIVDF